MRQLMRKKIINSEEYCCPELLKGMMSIDLCQCHIENVLIYILPMQNFTLKEIYLV